MERVNLNLRKRYSVVGGFLLILKPSRHVQRVNYIANNCESKLLEEDTNDQ
ncbi:unnamed protein product [Sphenostylis stenocarpa]|uniref:Uncharacterized protein n=1 Tax=Sphenostylis stenocarpa TaxID=92480 RepID=A0AA86SB56_9FABA|nr:unnamed protein product [Sphenostylis stenocarpa]